MIVSNMQNRISCLRKQCSLSQEQLAEILRISQSSLSKYEKDRLAIPSVVLIQMSEYFKVSVDYILGIGESDCPLTEKEMDDFLVLQIKALNRSQKFRLIQYFNEMSTDQIVKLTSDKALSVVRSRFSDTATTFDT